MRTRIWIRPLLTLSVAFIGCTDRAIVQPGSSHKGGRPSDASLRPDKMAQLRKYSEGGCAAGAPDESGAYRAVAIQRKNLPFNLPAIQYDKATGHGNGRQARMTVKRRGQTPVALSCFIPSTLSTDELAKSLHNSKTRHWSTLFSSIAQARSIPDSAHRGPLSAEAQAFKAELIEPRPVQNRLNASALLSSNCVQVKAYFEWYDEDNDEWWEIDIDFEICDEGGGYGDGFPGDGGGDVFFWILDHGYDDPPHVVVDASAYDITATDSVTFTARVISDVHLQAMGWQWIPASGSSWDPWTHECAGTDTTCRIQVHGSGRMYYTVQDQSSNNIIGSLRVIANIPPDVGGEDGDVPLVAAIDTGSAAATAVSATESSSILAYAISTGEWEYTQGCAHCVVPHGSPPGPNWEPAVDRPNHIGDCTDYVWWAIRNTLGTTAWPFAKISTTDFNRMYDSTTKLAKNGYVLVDSANVRAPCSRERPRR
jgi:hypothetical protein